MEFRQYGPYAPQLGCRFDCRCGQVYFVWWRRKDTYWGKGNLKHAHKTHLPGTGGADEFGGTLPDLPNTDQTDTDGDGSGNVCDLAAPGRLFVLEGQTDMIYELDPLTGALVNSLPTPEGATGGPDGLAFDVETNTLYFTTGFGTRQIWKLDADNGQTLWRELGAFAERNLHPPKPYVYIGIPQDSPDATAPEKQRFDACLVVDKPFSPQSKIGYQKIEEGYYGVFTHAGPYSTLAEAYQRLFQFSNSLQKFTIAPSFVFELMLDISATSIDEHTWTELYLPLKPRGALT